MVLVPAVPQFACDELVERDTVLNQSLIAKIGVLIVSNDVALEVGIAVHGRAARASWLEPRLWNISCQIKGEQVLDVLNPQIARWIERIGLGE